VAATRIFRALVSAACIAAVLIVAAIGVVPTAVASRRPGTRVVVAVFGDSVTESLDVTNFLRQGLVPQLSRSVSALGYAPGGVGLIPAAVFRWNFNRWVQFGTGPIPQNGWWAIGYRPNSGDDGPSGYSALSTSPLASATVAVSDPEVEILYTSTNVPCAFTVSAGGQTWTIDAFRPGPTIDTGTSLQLPPGRHALTIHGPSCGLLVFDGAVARRPVRPGQVQVEVDNLGHTAELPSLHFGPRVQQSLTDQRYDISVFLFGYVGEALFGPGISRPYLSAMTARARIAREHGGACLIVAPTPIAVPQAWVTAITRLERTVAHRVGCTYTTVLAHLWSSPTAAERRGLVFGDGIHPTAAGDRMIAHALAPIVAQMVHAHLHH
jgi:lysophospholipase L1-like esterase